MARILFVVTGSDHWTLADGTKHPTGFWAEEAVVPYEAFTAAGHEVVVATPGGVVPTVDRGSLAPEFNGGPEGAGKAAAALAGMTELDHPVRVEDVDLADYDAVYYPGGHGPMEDLSVNAASGKLLIDALGSGKPLGLVCHGLAALLATGENGENGGIAGTGAGGAFAGYRLTGFTNVEENQAGLGPRARWLLQDGLTGLGADFQEGEPWAPYVITDRNLVTGQNPASSAPVAAELLKRLA
ncbi:type 1 glutamine amidotransferase domain-containing protein [Streptomyces sp.]|uniref:type 1 glutamine amidotransferase domain-containing protein n=1 Tax=Streptomyces sp. TaxID=1931 RepID=UPI002F3F4571